ncbi:serine hydrolase [Candidatus Uhrbacteria bacterium]|nr:serine hydrolase [Candidatus Uhrbacteria bacterium]
MTSFRSGRFFHWSLIVAALVVGVSTTLVVDWQRARYRRTHRTLTGNSARPFRIADSEFRFIDPLLGYELPSRGSVEPFRTIRAAMESVVNEATQAREAADISAYYRDLTTGSWFGIGEDRAYAPASLAKVPLMIAYLKLTERHPELLQDRVTFRHAREAAPWQNVVPTERLVLGRTYTIADLIRAMIVHSDNEAAYLLQAAADQPALAGVYEDLNIDPPDFQNPRDRITPEACARFFRFLYNGTYLTRGRSEQALELLSKSTFDRGIVAGVPAEVTVSHKFGERIFTDVGVGVPTSELHDCGIVYHTDRPYLLCIMSRGWDLDALASVIARVSAAVYTEVDRIPGTNETPPSS